MFEPTESRDAQSFLAAQPPVRREQNALEKIRSRIADSGRKLVVLDDDPTGTQSVHGVPVLTTWADEDLVWGMRQAATTFFILTNSRSFSEEEAKTLNREIVAGLAAATAHTGTDFVVASRSDSTLRGHYPGEIDALREAFESAGKKEIDGVILCPCFLEAGRLTVDDIHWVRKGEDLVPTGQTEFASDANFGYSSSNLAGWVQEKTDGRVSADDVLRVSLADIREGGPGRVARILEEATGGQPIVVNAADYADLDVFVLGLLEAEAAGKSFLYRVGPSFVRSRGGIDAAPPVRPEDLYAGRGDHGHGLVVVGSHVEMTTRQLEKAIALGGWSTVELSVSRLLNSSAREEELDRVSEQINRALSVSDVMVYTSREVVTASENEKGLEISRSISGALVDLVRRLDKSLSLRFVVAKGGITSSDIGTRGLGVRRAEVAGTMLPGLIPVWILPEDSAFPDVPYVIFPGNVGEPDTLAEVIEILRE